MKLKLDVQGTLEMAIGAAVMLIIMLVILYFHRGQNPAEQLAIKTHTSELVTAMQLALSATIASLRASRARSR